MVEHGDSRKSNINRRAPSVDRSEDQLIDRFLSTVLKAGQIMKDVPREEVIQRTLWLLSPESRNISPRKNQEQVKEGYFETVIAAWSAVAYNRFSPGSEVENFAGNSLQERASRTNQRSIKLSDSQARIMEKLTEAVKIPYRPGQTEIAIPEKLKNYDKWVASKEYQQRLTKSKGKGKDDVGMEM